jgi:hypothetical protein
MLLLFFFIYGVLLAHLIIYTVQISPYFYIYYEVLAN